MNVYILFLIILFFFGYAFYDQFLMEKLKGKTCLKVRLYQRNKLEGTVLIALLGVAVYQSYPDELMPFYLFLLASFGVLVIYQFFIRCPVLILKPKGFFFANLYVSYDRINAINISENGFLQFVLKNGRALPIYIQAVDDIVKVLNFFVEIGRINPNQMEKIAEKIIKENKLRQK
ncbi:hypothetical protein CEP49_07170 [Mergibacter septicus]|uniref:YobD family protein n=1 Tax=Mergibacter septicus TaxID=221402 RepID=UPI001178E7FD|nr:DUF986 family protein [Mergibacter septicus]AWX14335.1 hypothetical protein CEP49_07170 [Mergibacter septicus]